MKGVPIFFYIKSPESFFLSLAIWTVMCLYVFFFFLFKCLYVVKVASLAWDSLLHSSCVTA